MWPLQRAPAACDVRVFITKGGSAFHNDPSCEALREGQEYAEKHGMNGHPIESVNWAEASENRQACLICCPRMIL